MKHSSWSQVFIPRRLLHSGCTSVFTKKSFTQQSLSWLFLLVLVISEIKHRFNLNRLLYTSYTYSSKHRRVTLQITAKVSVLSAGIRPHQRGTERDCWPLAGLLHNMNQQRGWRFIQCRKLLLT